MAGSYDLSTAGDRNTRLKYNQWPDLSAIGTFGYSERGREKYCPRLYSGDTR